MNILALYTVHEWAFHMLYNTGKGTHIPEHNTKYKNPNNLIIDKLQVNMSHTLQSTTMFPVL